MRWGHGPRAAMKKKLIEKGQLTDKGKPNEKTPREWLLHEGSCRFSFFFSGSFIVCRVFCSVGCL